jgi:hypothetical protein
MISPIRSFRLFHPCERFTQESAPEAYGTSACGTLHLDDRHRFSSPEAFAPSAMLHLTDCLMRYLIHSVDNAARNPV